MMHRVNAANRRPIRDITRAGGNPLLWQWTWSKLLALHDTCEAVRGALDDAERPTIATDLLDALRAAARHGATVAADPGHVTITAGDMQAVIPLPRWAGELLRPLAEEVTL